VIPPCKTGLAKSAYLLAAQFVVEETLQMTKYWKAEGVRGSRQIALYVETNDAAVEFDVSLWPASALMAGAVDTIPPAGEPRHRALAQGALVEYLRSAQVSSVGIVSEVWSIPAGLKNTWIGGKPGDPGTCVAVIHEEP